jgi:EF hand
MNTLRLMRRFLLGAAILAPTLALAQPPERPDGDSPPPLRGRRGGSGGGLGDDGPPPPGPLIMAALDTNRDGELSPEEIRNAAAALKTLDHNHDGVLDLSELDPRGGNSDGPDGPPDGPPQGRRFDRPTQDGPDGSRRGDRFGGPPPERGDGPPVGRRAMGTGQARPGLGNVLPPFVREPLSLNDRQRKQIAELETYVKAKLESILTAAQIRQARSSFERGPGGPGGPGGGPGGPGAFNGPGGGQGGPGRPPGFAQADTDEGPPTRPRRPQNMTEP